MSNDNYDKSLSKEDYIKLFRESGFNCFPIPMGQKEADYRYEASNTRKLQNIRQDENYGVIPIEGAGTCIIDLDLKDRFIDFVNNFKGSHLITETGKGFHLYVVNLTGHVQKVELFDYNVSKDKIAEIQGSKHYCVGIGSKIFHKKLDREVEYQNIGTNIIFDANGMNFHDFLDNVCKNLKLTPRERNRQGHYYLRQKFLNGKPPSRGESNDYFFNAALQCNTDGLTRQQAISKIREMYVLWQTTPDFSGREFSNIEVKINEVYDNDKKLEAHRPKGNKFDRTEIAKELVGSRKLYKNDKEIWENKKGFLEPANMSLKEELLDLYTEIEEADFNSVIFKLSGLLPAIPKTNKDLIVFKNGIYSKSEKQLIETEDIADMGFSDYEYIPDCPKPEKFFNVMFGNIPESEYPRLKAGLFSMFSGNLDSRISVIHGQPSTGKSTGLTILVKLLGEYGLTVELDQLLTDRFIRAKIENKRLLVLQDLPIDWKDFTQLKTLTGESVRTERRFHQDSTQFESKLKIWASGNYLAKIPEKEKNPMYSRRLSLIHNTRTEPYPENPTLIDDIIEQEGSQIISWILQFEDIGYEDRETVRREWEGLSSPEIEFIEKNYELVEDSTFTEEIGVIRIKRHFEEVMQQAIDIDVIESTLKQLGFGVRNMIIKNIKKKDGSKLT